MELFFRKYGAGKPLVILHGLFGSGDNWMTQAKMLGEHYLVYAVDLRNHGSSPHADAFSYNEMAEDVRKFLTENVQEPAILIGHSMGGKVAMKVAGMYPELISRLIVVDIVPKSYPLNHQHIMDALCAMDIEVLSSRQEADEILSKSVSEPEVRQFLLKNLSRNPSGGFLWKMNLHVIASNRNEIFSDPMGNLRYAGPVLFVFGRRSDYYKQGDEQKIKDHFPNHQIEFLETGHWVQAEKPLEFVQLISKFLMDQQNG
jgi:esterase